jgi:hypothetical protein
VEAKEAEDEEAPEAVSQNKVTINELNTDANIPKKDQKCINNCDQKLRLLRNKNSSEGAIKVDYEMIPHGNEYLN